MKKTKYLYSSYMQHYECDGKLDKSDLLEFYSKTGVKLHTEMYTDEYGQTEQIGYTWEYVENEDLPRWYVYLGPIDVEIDQDPVELDQSNSKPVNWQPNWKNLEKRKMG